jgi:microcystin-dependent protein
MSWATKTFTFSPSTTIRSAEVNANYDDLVDGLNTAMPASATGCGIIIFSGAIASIPTGWYLCNGANGTPDLMDRFVVGAGSTYAVGATGGEATHTLTEAELASHNHGGVTGNVSADHTHTFSGTSSGQSATHNHNSQYSGSGTDVYLTSTGNYGDTVTNTCPTGNASGDHTHTYSGTTSGTSANHTHSISSAGSGTAHENRPPYYALAYIMKAY